MFNGIFAERPEGESEGNTDFDEDEEDPNSYEDTQRQAFQKQWGLYDMINKLCDGDLLKIQQMYELPVASLFAHLAYLQASGWKKTT